MFISASYYKRKHVTLVSMDNQDEEDYLLKKVPELAGKESIEFKDGSRIKTFNHVNFEESLRLRFYIQCTIDDYEKNPANKGGVAGTLELEFYSLRYFTDWYINRPKLLQYSFGMRKEKNGDIIVRLFNVKYEDIALDTELAEHKPEFIE